MDYAPRGTLRQIYPPGSRLPADLIVEYVWEITSALQYLHDNGLIHRDVKPANLLLSTHNELLLSDFGITVARQEAQVDTAGTSVHATIGLECHLHAATRVGHLLGCAGWAGASTRHSNR